MKLLKKLLYLSCLSALITAPSIIRASLSPFDVVIFLTETLHLQNILQNQLFIQTSPLINRPLYTLPSLSFTGFPLEDKFKISLFYNGTWSGLHFNNNQTGLVSALDVSQLSLSGSSDLFDEIFSQPPFSTINFPLIGNLFDDIVIQEHRLGGMFQYATCFNDYYFLARAPLYYQVHNVYMSPEIQNRFGDELAIPFSTFNVQANRDATEQFVLQNLVADRLGLGELQLLFGKGYSICQNGLFTPTFELVLPVNISIKRGLLGGDFKYAGNSWPNFSLYTLMSYVDPTSPQSNPDAGIDYFYTIFTSMLNRMTAALYDLPLGQQNVGLGLQSTLEWCVNKDQHVGFFSRAQYKIPSITTRYASPRTPESSFVRDYTDPLLADENLTFLSNQFLYRMLLAPVCVIKSPGLQFQGQFYTRIMASDIELSLGVDGFYQGAETIKINQPSNSFIQQFDASVITSQPMCCQFKIFGGADGKTTLFGHPISLGGHVDVSIASYNIGDDFTFAFTFSTQF